METPVLAQIKPEDVQPILSEHMLTKGMMRLVLDLEKSRGIDLYDKLTGRHLYDFFGFYASNALGMNHPGLTEEADFLKRLKIAALNKVTNSDVPTEYLARFVQTFSRVAMPGYLPYTFFIAGGALAVENALKAAFDWKVRKNFAKGYRREVGHQVLHFDQAFHGRTGYTLSLTNTEPKKTAHFPKFDWPRVLNPRIRFPRTEENLEITEKEERLAIAQAKTHFHENRDDIACIIIEPIQGEGGDNHFRPEFLRELKALAHENDALLVFDEVQTGVGITGAFWAHQALGVEPDLMAFGKKTQVCGFLASRKLDEVQDHVFQVPSRINSTWGGNLVDMVRFDRILEVIEEDRLVEHAGRVGGYLQDRLHELPRDFPVVTSVRGLGLMCAFDLPTPAERDQFLKTCFDKGLVILGCGPRSVRFRSPLTIAEKDVDAGLSIIRDVLSA
ncbi:MAG TPA: L-lysine 6-transaminase [Rhodothermales bacterium]|nr:L-lysine 6-transaminase [Rhodothermales bacterium]